MNVTRTMRMFDYTNNRVVFPAGFVCRSPRPLTRVAASKGSRSPFHCPHVPAAVQAGLDQQVRLLAVWGNAARTGAAREKPISSLDARVRLVLTVNEDKIFVCVALARYSITGFQ